jgi:hypothetical protein
MKRKDHEEAIYLSRDVAMSNHRRQSIVFNAEENPIVGCKCALVNIEEVYRLN